MLWLEWESVSFTGNLVWKCFKPWFWFEGFCTDVFCRKSGPFNWLPQATDIMWRKDIWMERWWKGLLSLVLFSRLRTSLTWRRKKLMEGSQWRLRGLNSRILKQLLGSCENHGSVFCTDVPGTLGFLFMDAALWRFRVQVSLAAHVHQLVWSWQKGGWSLDMSKRPTKAPGVMANGLMASTNENKRNMIELFTRTHFWKMRVIGK